MSTLTTTIVAASFLAAGFGYAALPTGGTDAATAILVKDQARLSERLEGAFAAAAAVAVDDRMAHRVAAAARKADRRPSAKDCRAQAWPNITPDCLTGAASRPPSAVRTVTVEYRVGEATSVLVRLPSTQVAGR